MYQSSVKVPIGEWAKTRFKSMAKNDFVRITSGTNSKFGRNVSNWLNKKKVYPHNVLDFANASVVRSNLAQIDGESVEIGNTISIKVNPLSLKVIIP